MVPALAALCPPLLVAVVRVHGRALDHGEQLLLHVAVVGDEPLPVCELYLETLIVEGEPGAGD